MKANIINGIFIDGNGDFRTSYPQNLVPVPKTHGINAGYLLPAPGIVEFGEGPGIDRGGINWNDTCYRASGSYLIKVRADGTNETIGVIQGVNNVSFDYSFSYLGINSNENLFLYDGVTLTQITDSDLGKVLDFVWIDGYFACTDGSSIVVTELNNPFSVNPTKYGSSEIDPDPIIGLEELRNELVALNRYTIEFFDNVGGSGFPFQRIEGAQIQRGVVGKDAFCIFDDKLAFLGSGRNEPLGVWIAYNGTSVKISTREIDKIIKNFSEYELKRVMVESRYDENNQHLWVRLPDRTCVYDLLATKELGQPVWFFLHSGLGSISEYRGKNLVWVYDRWVLGDPTSGKYGYLSDSVATHYGENVTWSFDTQIIYNETRGAIFHEIELVALTGYVDLNSDPKIYTQYSKDGVTWSVPKFIRSGKQGDKTKRLRWLSQGAMLDRRIQRFRGDSSSRLTISRLDIRLEPLYV